MKTVIFGLLLCATPVWAGNLCYSSSAAEDAQLADAATREGTTGQAKINSVVSGMISSSYSAAVNQAIGTAIANQWGSFTAQKKTNICTALSVSPCPP